MGLRPVPSLGTQSVSSPIVEIAIESSDGLTRESLPHLVFDFVDILPRFDSNSMRNIFDLPRFCSLNSNDDETVELVIDLDGPASNFQETTVALVEGVSHISYSPKNLNGYLTFDQINKSDLEELFCGTIWSSLLR